MNKKIIAIAIAGALAAPMAAQAEATIYGKVHVSIDSINNDNPAAVKDSGIAMSSNSSRIGFKGSEDLGGGMKAIWQYESAIGIGDNSSKLAGRNTFAGLAGNFGAVLVGRHDTPYKMVGRSVDLFGDTIGDSRTLINWDGQDARPNNVIAYATPNMGGFSALAAYVTDLANDKNDNNDNSATSIMAKYANGPLMVGLGYQDLTKKGLIAAGHTTATEDAKATRLVGSYSMGSMKFVALWQDSKSAGGVKDNDRTVWGIGGAFKLGGGNTIKAQYYAADKIKHQSKTDANKFAIGFDHAMSKTTTLYAAYAVMNNGSNSDVNIIGNDGHGDSGPAGATKAGGTPNAFSIGMTHKF